MVIMSKKKLKELTNRISELEEVIKRINELDKTVKIVHDELFEVGGEKKSIVYSVLRSHADILNKHQPIIDKASLAMGIEQLKDSKEQQDIHDEWLFGENKKDGK